MDRLHALDALWLEMEHGGPPLAMGLVSILEGPPPPVGQVREMVAARLADVPGMRWVVSREHGVRRPQWAVTDEVDLRHHVRARHVASGADSLDEFVSRLMEEPLDLSRPLWELTVARGLPEGRWALIWRLHHSVSDGIGARTVMGHFFDLEPRGGMRLVEAASRGMLPRTSTAEQVTPPRGILGQVAGVTRRAASGAVDAVRHLPTAGRVIVDATPRPPGSLTGTISERRRWVSATEDLTAAKAAARALDARLNDLILAAVARGLHDLLSSRGEETDGRTVRCAVPVSTRPTLDSHADNRVSVAWADLPVGEETPEERIAAISRSTSWQKRAGTPLVGSALLSLTDHLVPSPVQDVVVRHGTWVPAWFAETLVTNVPGAPFPLYVMGRQLHHVHPVIPVDGHLRITVGLVSHDDTLGIGITGDGTHARDVDVLLAGMSVGFREIEDAARDMSKGHGRL